MPRSPRCWPSCPSSGTATAPTARLAQSAVSEGRSASTRRRKRPIFGDCAEGTVCRRGCPPSHLDGGDCGCRGHHLRRIGHPDRLRAARQVAAVHRGLVGEPGTPEPARPARRLRVGGDCGRAGRLHARSTHRPALWVRPDGRFIRQSHLLRAQAYFDRRGPATVVVARFLPVVRTFTPILAGVARMRLATFIVYNVVGGSCIQRVSCCWGTPSGAPFPGSTTTCCRSSRRSPSRSRCPRSSTTPGWCAPTVSINLATRTPLAAHGCRSRVARPGDERPAPRM